MPEFGAAMVGGWGEERQRASETETDGEENVRERARERARERESERKKERERGADLRSRDADRRVNTHGQSPTPSHRARKFV